MEEIVHEDNDWGISLVEEENTETTTESHCTKSELVEGLQVNNRKLLLYLVRVRTKLEMSLLKVMLTIFFLNFSMHMIRDPKHLIMMKAKLKTIPIH